LARANRDGRFNAYHRLTLARKPHLGMVSTVEQQQGLRGSVKVVMYWADFQYLLEDFQQAFDLYKRIQRATRDDRDKTVYARAVLGEMLTLQRLERVRPERNIARMFELVQAHPRTPSAPHLLELCAYFTRGDPETRRAFRQMIHTNYPNSPFAIRARYQQILAVNRHDHDTRAKKIEALKRDFPEREEYHAGLDLLQARLREIYLNNIPTDRP